jgi:hypothetical protein
VGGYDGDQVWLVKTDAVGNMQWQKDYGTAVTEGGFDVWPTSDGGYVIAATKGHREAVPPQCYLIKTDGNGNPQWEKTYPGVIDSFAVRQTPDGGYVVPGNTAPVYYPTGCDPCLLKVDGNGNEQWRKTYGGVELTGVARLAVTSDGGFVLAGGAQVSPTNPDPAPRKILLIKTDAQGNLQWRKLLGSRPGGPNVYTGTFPFRQTSDGGYVHACSLGSARPSVVKTDPNGTLQWEKEITVSGASAEVSATPTAPPALHVQNIAMELIKSGVNYTAKATVLVCNQAGTPVEGATVVGDWYYKGSRIATGSSGVTDATGKTAISSPPKKARIGDVFTFVVTNIVKAGCIYNPAANVETQDSIAVP